MLGMEHQSTTSIRRYTAVIALWREQQLAWWRKRDRDEKRVERAQAALTEGRTVRAYLETGIEPQRINESDAEYKKRYGREAQRIRRQRETPEQTADRKRKAAAHIAAIRSGKKSRTPRNNPNWGAC